MYDDDGDLIEQVSDDDDENMEDDGRGSRGRRPDGIDDEPALEGYERYVILYLKGVKRMMRKL